MSEEESKPTPQPAREEPEAVADQNQYVSRADYDKLRSDYEQTLAALTETITESDALKERIAQLEPLEGQTSELTRKARSLEAARAL